MILEIITILLFYLFAVLQTSFFAHFLFFGATLNLVFIMFALTIFFLPKKIHFKIFLYALAAGLILDMYSYTYFGVSAVLLLIIGFLFKKIQIMLKEDGDGFSFAHFIALFVVCFAVYEIAQLLYHSFLGLPRAGIILNFTVLAGIIYNALVASLGFFLYKKIRPLLRE